MDISTNYGEQHLPSFLYYYYYCYYLLLLCTYDMLRCFGVMVMKYSKGRRGKKWSDTFTSCQVFLI